MQDFLAGITVGAIILQTAIFAPTIFTTIEAQPAGKLLRALFPKFFKLILVLGVAAVACLLLGFVLGPSLEEYCRRSLSLSDGNPLIFLTSPDSLFFLALTGVFYYFMVVRKPEARQHA